MPQTAMRGNNGLKTVATNALIVLVAAVLGLGIGEAFVRFKNADMRNYDIEMWRYAKELKFRSDDPELGHEHRTNAQAVLQSVLIRTNDKGLRGGALQPAPEGGRRILVLGSSITLGWGVPEEQTFTALLQDKLNAAGEKVQVLNAGIGNYNAARYSHLFFTRLSDLRPTDIVVHYFLRDAEALDAAGGNWLLRNSELVMTLWIAWTHLQSRYGTETLVGHYQDVYREDAPGYQKMKQSLAAIADYATRNNIRIYLAIIPDIHTLRDYPLAFAHRQVGELAESLGYHTLDLLPYFSGMDSKEIWAMPGDPHPNALGHRIMADAAFPLLRLGPSRPLTQIPDQRGR